MVVEADSVRAASLRLTYRVTLTLGLCGIGALVDGFDTQAMGVAGPPVIREFALTAAVAGWLFSGGTLGQTIGSTLGGRLADRMGRKWALIASLLLIGVCSLATVVSTTVAGLFITRILAGLGLGSAIPNFITLASESVAPARRHRWVSWLMAGFPIGGTLASVTSLGNGIGWGWRTIFVIGGVAPLAAGLAAIWAIREPEPASSEIAAGALPSTVLAVSPPPVKPPSRPAPARQPDSLARVLFGAGRARATLLLWVAFFFTQLILLLMLNWLPSLVVRSGFSDTQASGIQIVFGVCGIFGSYVVGTLQSGTWRRTGVAVTYLAIAAALAAAGVARHLYAPVLLAAAAAGVFIVGAQLALYALAPLYYARPIRASGVGGAIAIGRLGSVVGPLFAGLLLAGGGSSSTVLLGIEPFVLIGGVAAFALCWCARVRD